MSYANIQVELTAKYFNCRTTEQSPFPFSASIWDPYVLHNKVYATVWLITSEFPPEKYFLVGKNKTHM